MAAIVVNANGGPHLDEALRSLARQTVPPERTIVVDNASRDGSADGLEERHPGVEVLRPGENVGFAAANNLAVRAAETCDWIALVNPDAFPEPQWLETLLAAAAAHPECTFFGSRLVSAADPDVLDGTGDVLHVSGMAWRRDHGSPGVERSDEEVFSPCAAAALYRRDAFLEVGGFDERFFCYFEDTDLAFRLRLAGHRCLYVDAAVCRHVGSALAGRDSDFTIYHSYRNQVWTYLKNMPLGLLLLYAPQHLLVNLLTVLAYGTRGQAGVVLRAKRDALRALPQILRQRRAIQRDRRIGSRELRRLMARGPGGFARTFFQRFDLRGARARTV
ncbi:MAG TPA: glycosyltransferase family 2 protein [Gaiellaceae bacterium]